jgi:hypothetical protein
MTRTHRHGPVFLRGTDGLICFGAGRSICGLDGLGSEVWAEVDCPDCLHLLLLVGTDEVEGPGPTRTVAGLLRSADDLVAGFVAGVPLVVERVVEHLEAEAVASRRTDEADPWTGMITRADSPRLAGLYAMRRDQRAARAAASEQSPPPGVPLAEALVHAVDSLAALISGGATTPTTRRAESLVRLILDEIDDLCGR